MVAAVKLRRHTGRRRSGRFLAEGPNLVAAAARRGLVDEVFATGVAAQRHRELLAGLTVNPVTDRAAKALSETVTPSGLVAVCRVPAVHLDEVLARGPSLVAVADGLSEPGNAGTLIRLADAMGAAAVVFAGHSVDPYNGKCLRSSAGSVFDVPVVVEPDTPAVVSRLRSAGLQVMATTLDGELSVDDCEPLLGAPTVWLFGAESQGLDDEVVAMADHRVSIPMSGGAESLNVAAAAAICLYLSARTRRRGQESCPP